MSYTPQGLPFISAYNAVFQNESSGTFDLDFDTFVNVDNVGATRVVIPDNAFIWGDCKSTRNGTASDYRHHFRLQFTQSSLTDEFRSVEYSGQAGSRNNPASSDIAYSLNKTGTTQNTGLRSISLYNDHDQLANYNRLVGVLIQ
jgi:hypothetical protein